MFVPVVPYVPHTTIINKTIVYSDTVLPLKDSGSNLKVASISNVSESSLESCLKKIFESNPNVVFNTIQYSKNDEKLYFYTDKEISTKEYEESKICRYKPITSSTGILEELKRILTLERNKDNNCISLYDVALVISNMKYKYERTKDSYASSMEYALKRENSSASFIVYDFDFYRDELRTSYKFFKDYDKIIFSKRNNDLYIAQSECCWAKDIFPIIAEDLSKLYDELIKFKDFNKQYNYGFRTFNSNFLANVSQHGVSIETASNDFELRLGSYNREYKCNCNSSIVVSSFNGKEEEILKRIFVKIEDCPKWAQQALYEIRQNQLEEEQKIEDERIYQEMKNQKKLEFKRKIFPWLKNKE